MQVRIVERPEYDDVVIYAWHEVGEQRWPMVVDGTRLSAQRPTRPDDLPGAEMPVTLIMRSGEFAALTEAIRASGPHGSVEADALADARTVRDRLLTMIEESW